MLGKAYKLFALIGVISFLISLINNYIYTFIDINITKVILPMSLVYLLMIVTDYFVRGRS